jgi:topoisomerase-4 subunit B
MDPKKRTLLRVMLAPEDRSFTSERVEELMGRRPELRFRFIQENAGRIAAEALDA